MTTTRSKLPLLGALATAAVLAACATDRTPPPELVAAREAVRQAQASPQVLAQAPLELKKAGDTLRRADELNAKGEALADVLSTSYVAQRQAETAQAVAQAKTNEDGIRGAEVDRERARADARGAEARRAQAQAAAARADASTAQQQATTAQQQAEAARLQAGDAEARAMAARQQASQAQASAATAQQQLQDLQQQLSDLQAQHTDRGTLVTLGDVLFEFGRAEIKPSAQQSLRRLADYLQAHPERRVLIEGFTDSVGSDSVNLTLSQRRADTVSSALAAMGVAGDRINTRGYGKSFPIADNSTDTNRALNRRVEIYISDNDQPVRARG